MANNNATAVYSYKVRVPGARWLKVQQKMVELGPAGRRTKYVSLRSRAVSSNAGYQTVTTRKGTNRGYRYLDAFRVTTTYGTGANEQKNTWQFTIRQSKSMTLSCATCVARAGLKPSATRATPQAGAGTGGNGLAGTGGNGFASTHGTGSTGTGSTGNGLAGTGGYTGGYTGNDPDAAARLAANCARILAEDPNNPAAMGICKDFVVVDSVTDSTVGVGEGEEEAEVLTVDPDLDGTTDEEKEAVSEELDELVDTGVVVEVPQETVDALAVVEGEDSPLAALPFDVPPAVEPYVVPAAGALVGALAGRFLGDEDRTALGALLGGAAAYLYGEMK